MDLGLTGRVALVTGASKGIGKAIATALAAEGATVAMASPSRERIDAAAREAGGYGFVLDSEDVDAAPALVDEVEATLGPGCLRTAARTTRRRTCPPGPWATRRSSPPWRRFLCGAPASYVTGAALVVDGGLTRGI